MTSEIAARDGVRPVLAFVPTEAQTVYYAPPRDTCRACWLRACADARRARELAAARERARREDELARRRVERRELEVLGKLPGQLGLRGVG